MTTFTDEQGNKWEEPLDNSVPGNPTHKIIRPVKQPKWSVEFGMHTGQIFVNLNPIPTKDQAQAIKEAVEALMTVITNTDDLKIVRRKLKQSILETRQAMRENN